MEFSPWTMLTDLGLIAVLLLVGTLLRAKIPFIQNLFLPASLIAGIMGLVLGPGGLGILPFSNQIGTYPSVLIAVIFGALPIAAKKIPFKTISNRVGSMWSFSQIAMISLWGVGVLFTVIFLHPVIPGLPDGFGLLLAAGFVGGHGTAAAIGEAFNGQGWEEATSLAMTSATIGVVSAILIGLYFVKAHSKKGNTSFISDFKDLPNELRTGLIPEEKREATKMDTFSSISIDPLMVHLSIVGIVAAAGYVLADLLGSAFPQFAPPAFSLAFLVGILLQQVLHRTKMDHYLSRAVITRISGGATDLLVAFGIASISLPVVVDYIVPLSLLLIFGLVFNYMIFRFLSQCFFTEHWFERGLFTFGWATGTVAMGIALLRIVDPDLKSNTLDDFGLAYIPIAPVEIAIVTFSPFLLMNQYAWVYVGATLGAAVIILILSRINGWMGRPTAANRFEKY